MNNYDFRAEPISFYDEDGILKPEFSGINSYVEPSWNEKIGDAVYSNFGKASGALALQDFLHSELGDGSTLRNLYRTGSNALTAAGKTQRQLIQALKPAINGVVNSGLGSAFKGMHYPFMATLAYEGANALNDLYNGVEDSPYVDSLGRTARNLAAFEGATALHSSGHPIVGTALAVGNWYLNKVLEEKAKEELEHMPMPIFTDEGDVYYDPKYDPLDTYDNPEEITFQGD